MKMYGSQGQRKVAINDAHDNYTLLKKNKNRML